MAYVNVSFPDNEVARRALDKAFASFDGAVGVTLRLEVVAVRSVTPGFPDGDPVETWRLIAQKAIDGG